MSGQQNVTAKVSKVSDQLNILQLSGDIYATKINSNGKTNDRMAAQDRQIPINERLSSKKVTDSFGLKLTPRKYQDQLFLKTLEQNLIVYLGTGLGKTYIVVLYLRSPRVDECLQKKLKVVFMAPTQDLVKQQAEYINKQVKYRVKVYCGRTSRCGHWSSKAWLNELESVDILFMTPQIFSSAISNSRLRWSQFCAVIFDECHHASRGKDKKDSHHPYREIMRHYNAFFKVNSSPRPRIVGLTASLVNSMPKNRDSIREEVRHLEDLYDAKCVTDAEVVESKPQFIVNCFSCPELQVTDDKLTKIFVTSANHIENAIIAKKAEIVFNKRSNDLTKEQIRLVAYNKKLKLAATGFSIKPENFAKVIEGLIKIRQRCGLWMLDSICLKLIEALESKTTAYSDLNKDVIPIYMDFIAYLKKVHICLDDYLSICEGGHRGILKLTRMKPKALLDVLKDEYKRTGTEEKATFSCIVFVRNRLEVVALNSWLQHLSCTLPQEYGFIKCDYAIGIAATMTSKWACITKRKATEQGQMLENFRNGLLNIIVTTSVLEEGIDLPVCSTVIRYDQVRTFREYVQSRGRARQLRSSFITICDDTLFTKTVDGLNKFDNFERTVKDVLISNNVDPVGRLLSTPINQPRSLGVANGEDNRFSAQNNDIGFSSSTAVGEVKFVEQNCDDNTEKQRSSEDSSYEDDDTVYSEDEISYDKHITGRNLSDDDNEDIWDLSQYQVSASEPTPFRRKDSTVPHTDKVQDYKTQHAEEFDNLFSDLKPIQTKLTSKLKKVSS